MVAKDDLLIPRGWRKAFGDDLVKELNEIDREVEILDSKEKWGELRLVVSPYLDAVDDIEQKYSEISRHICISCGKPDVPMMNFGWISPVCEDCWSKFSKRPYDECVADSYRCPTFVNVKHSAWINGVEFAKTNSIDLSEEMERIRKRFRNENKNIADSSGSDVDAFHDEDVGEAAGTDKE